MNKKEQIVAAGKLQVLNSINRLSPRFISTNDKKRSKKQYNRPILGIIAQQFRIERSFEIILILILLVLTIDRRRIIIIILHIISRSVCVTPNSMHKAFVVFISNSCKLFQLPNSIMTQN
jgi:hypothetical protein